LSNNKGVFIMPSSEPAGAGTTSTRIKPDFRTCQEKPAAPHAFFGVLPTLGTPPPPRAPAAGLSACRTPPASHQGGRLPVEASPGPPARWKKPRRGGYRCHPWCDNSSVRPGEADKPATGCCILSLSEWQAWKPHPDGSRSPDSQ